MTARSAYHSRALLLLSALKYYAVRHELWDTANLCVDLRFKAREAWAGEVFPRAGLQRI